MRKQELFRHVLDYFRQTMDDTETELNYSNPFELLVAVVLSAQNAAVQMVAIRSRKSVR